VPTDRGVAQLG